MKQTILETCDTEACRKHLNRQKCRYIFLILAALLCNVLFTAIRTDDNHWLMLVLNILTDAGTGCFLIYHVTDRFLPEKKRYDISVKPGEQIQGTVEAVSETVVRYLDMDCLEVTMNGRRMFLPVNTIRLPVGQKVRLRVVWNVIVEEEH